MKDRNICKFITDPSQDKFEIHSFIYESNPEIMKTPYQLAHHRAILIKQGKGECRFDNQNIAFNTGCLIFGFKDEIFSVVSNEACEYMYINFSGTRSEALFRRFGINKNNRCFAEFDGIIPLWCDSLHRASQINIDLTAESMLLYTFSRLNCISSKQNNLINDIIEISEGEFTNPELSLSSIANELGYNSKYISHFFKEKMGTGYSEYLRTLRIKYAVSLFDHGIDSVKNVAYLSGFTDPLYFSTTFKKIIGISPKEYKNKR